MDVGARIKASRERRGKTLLETANYLGVTEATVQRYESGNIKNLKLDTISKIASFLNVNPAYIMGWSKSEENIQTKHKYSYYPTSVSAGTPIVAESVAEYEVEKIELPDAVMGKWAGHQDLKIMRINGESMNKSIPDQSFIVVKPTPFSQLKDGDIVVFNKEFEYSTKRFYNDKQKERFIFKPDSDDPSYTDLIVEYENAESLIIEGRVVLYIVELD